VRACVRVCVCVCVCLCVDLALKPCSSLDRNNWRAYCLSYLCDPSEDLSATRARRAQQARRVHPPFSCCSLTTHRSSTRLLLSFSISDAPELGSQQATGLSHEASFTAI